MKSISLLFAVQGFATQGGADFEVLDHCRQQLNLTVSLLESTLRLLASNLVPRALVTIVPRDAFPLSKWRGAAGVEIPGQGYQNTPKVLEHFVAQNWNGFVSFKQRLQNARKEIRLATAKKTSENATPSGVT